MRRNASRKRRRVRCDVPATLVEQAERALREAGPVADDVHLVNGGAGPVMGWLDTDDLGAS